MRFVSPTSILLTTLGWGWRRRLPLPPLFGTDMSGEESTHTVALLSVPAICIVTLTCTLLVLAFLHKKKITLLRGVHEPCEM